MLPEKYIYIYIIGNGQPRKPALCQLYRHTFVPYSGFHRLCVGRTLLKMHFETTMTKLWYFERLRLNVKTLASFDHNTVEVNHFSVLRSARDSTVAVDHLPHLSTPARTPSHTGSGATTFFKDGRPISWSWGITALLQKKNNLERYINGWRRGVVVSGVRHERS